MSTYINKLLGDIFTNLKKDNVVFFQQNWTDIKQDTDIYNNFLSYCFDNKSFKTIDFALNNNCRKLSLIVVSNIIKSQDHILMDIVKKNNLFDIDGEAGKNLFNIAIFNNDIDLINNLKPHIIPNDESISFIWQRGNFALLDELISLGFTFNKETNYYLDIINNYDFWGDVEKQSFEKYKLLIHSNINNKDYLYQAHNYIKDNYMSDNLIELLKINAE